MRPVLLYDGTCGLCNRVVRLLLRTDQAGRLSYVPLQSAPAQEYLLRQGLPTEDFDSLVFVPDWDAAAVVGGPWRLVTWTSILPAGLRDFFYRLVARSRYALFGEYRGKPLAESEWSGRFL